MRRAGAGRKRIDVKDKTLLADLLIEGNQSRDRNAQFEHINAMVASSLAAHQPAISVDTNK